MNTPPLPTRDERRSRRRERRAQRGPPLSPMFDISHLTPEKQQWFRSHRIPMSSTDRRRAEIVWRYISLISSNMRPSRENWFHAIDKQICPQGAVFQWESVVMTCIDMPYIRDELDPETYDRLILTKDVPTLIADTEHIPLHTVDLLESEHVLSSCWRDLPQEVRDECGMDAMLLFFMSGDDRYAELEDTEDVGIPRLSASRVIQSRAEEHINFFKMNQQMWGKRFGALCAACEKISRDCKRCSACEQVYYCDTKCQRSHWPEHKANCKTHRRCNKVAEV